jgi:hypothetical protein
MMTKAEKELIKLRSENVQLREQLEKLMKIYREQLYEIVDYKTRKNLIENAMDRGNDGT